MDWRRPSTADPKIPHWYTPSQPSHFGQTGFNPAQPPRFVPPPYQSAPAPRPPPPPPQFAPPPYLYGQVPYGYPASTCPPLEYIQQPMIPFLAPAPAAASAPVPAAASATVPGPAAPYHGGSMPPPLSDAPPGIATISVSSACVSSPLPRPLAGAPDTGLVSTSQVPSAVSASSGTSAPCQPQEPSRKLWVSNLPLQADERWLLKTFDFGNEVTHVKVMRHKVTGQSTGYAVIDFRSHEDAKVFLQNWNNKIPLGSHMALAIKWPRSSLYEVYVGNLSPAVTDSILLATFTAQYNSVQDAKVITNPDSNLSKGYGFVKFADESEMRLSIKQMTGAMCLSKRITVREAKRKVFVQPGSTTTGMMQETSYVDPQAKPPGSDSTLTNIKVAAEANKPPRSEELTTDGQDSRIAEPSMDVDFQDEINDPREIPTVEEMNASYFDLHGDVFHGLYDR